MRHVIALDASGTETRAALVALDGTPLYETRRPTTTTPPLGLAEDLRGHGRKHFGAQAEAAALATGPGRTDPRTRELLSRALGDVPVVLEHGVRAAALAEARIGAGRERDRFLFVSPDRTVTGAIVLDGRIEAGAGHAGAIGHLTVRPDGRPCPCGRRGCLDTLASTAAITRAWRRATGTATADALACARAADAGDKAAAEVWRTAVDALADALATALTILDPGTVIVGGALARTGETLLTPLRRAVTDRLTFQKRPAVVAAALDDAAYRGAGLLARDLVAGSVPAAAPDAL
ncbi:ROK family protein [Streptomyces sp. NPDC059534]|uniref:ROK family protein n=1 Tax=Streptomyces sp. NPDC059534 TaxID=3346859 RepID=UPI00369E64DC